MSSFNLDAYLNAQQQRVEALLRSRMEELGTHVPPRLHEAIRYSLLAGGKRLRPVLCLSFAEAVLQQSTVSRVVEDSACALEFIHTHPSVVRTSGSICVHGCTGPAIHLRDATTFRLAAPCVRYAALVRLIFH